MQYIVTYRHHDVFSGTPKILTNFEIYTQGELRILEEELPKLGMSDLVFMPEERHCRGMFSTPVIQAIVQQRTNAFYAGRSMQSLSGEYAKYATFKHGGEEIFDEMNLSRGLSDADQSFSVSLITVEFLLKLAGHNIEHNDAYSSAIRQCMWWRMVDNSVKATKTIEYILAHKDRVVMVLGHDYAKLPDQENAGIMAEINHRGDVYIHGEMEIRQTEHGPQLIGKIPGSALPADLIGIGKISIKPLSNPVAYTNAPKEPEMKKYRFTLEVQNDQGAVIERFTSEEQVSGKPEDVASSALIAFANLGSSNAQKISALLSQKDNVVKCFFSEIKAQEFYCVAYDGQGRRLAYFTIEHYAAKEALKKFQFLLNHSHYGKSLLDRVAKYAVTSTRHQSLDTDADTYRPEGACFLNPFAGTPPTVEFNEAIIKAYPLLSKLDKKPYVQQVMHEELGEIFEVSSFSFEDYCPVHREAFALEMQKLMKTFDEWIKLRQCDFTPPNIRRSSGRTLR